MEINNRPVKVSDDVINVIKKHKLCDGRLEYYEDFIIIITSQCELLFEFLLDLSQISGIKVHSIMRQNWNFRIYMKYLKSD